MRLRMSLVLCLAMAITGIFAVPANAAESASRGTAVSLPPQPTSAPKGAGAVQSTSGTKDCAQVQAELDRYAALGHRQVGCVTVTPAGKRPGAGDPSVAAWCRDLAAGQWWIFRKSACIRDIEVLYTLIEVPSGRPLGNGLLAVTQEIDLDEPFEDFSEDVSVTLVAVTGQVRSLQVGFEGECGSPCSTVDGDAFDGLESLRPGETEEGFLRYDGQAGNGVVSFGLEYTLTVLMVGAIPIVPSVSWDGPGTVRCDNVVGGAPGCVLPDYPVRFDVTVSAYGASAMMIYWAQNYLPDRWGTNGKPLHRLASEAESDANRRAICRDGTFVPRPDVSEDSCDEYAFARSRESGARFGLTGIDCAEIVPKPQPDGTWFIEYIRYRGTERCVRGHVPNPQNSGLGGELGRFVQRERVIDAEAYTVGVWA